MATDSESSVVDLQQDLQQAADSAPSSGPARTNGRDPAGRFAPGNDLGQRFAPGNVAALVHGGRRLQLGRGTSLDEARRVELRDAVLLDLGGQQECSSVLCELVQDFAAAVLLRDVAYAHLAAVGPLTRAGRRRAVVDLYLQASARAERLASQIGTARRPARVPSLHEYLAARADPPPEHGLARDDDQSDTGDSGAQDHHADDKG